MSALNTDILIGMLFIIAIWSFMFCQFIISALLFAGTGLFSYMAARRDGIRL